MLVVAGSAGGMLYWPATEVAGTAASAPAAGGGTAISPATARRIAEAADLSSGSSLATALRPAVPAQRSAADRGPEPSHVLAAGTPVTAPSTSGASGSAGTSSAAPTYATAYAATSTARAATATVETVAATSSTATSSTSSLSSTSSRTAAFRTYLAGRPGHVSVAFYDAVAGTTVALTDPAVAGYETASSVKLDILTALVQRAGDSGRLPARQQALARKMISVSDNSAASALWSDAGGTAGMNAFFGRLGMSSTRAGSGGRWGLTSTTGADQLAVLRAVSYPGVLTAAQRGVISSLLKTVVPAQRWGLTGGVPAGVTVDLKNGWLPRTSGWVITSLAHVHGDGRDYIMAVYTKNGPSMASGVATVQGLSALAWRSARSARAPAAVGG
ncbi:serine hydrolase [Frankia sp. AgB32]|uniref:serine hydrolase n=1 Tax=Frankia sp. AgB32 TaxID=631119 RepID=UPI00200EE27C|nr:serine hydrolase [Frankia sp. AgB32]MCK9897857.1 class A beta-lactamase-related serine hydrolase [Frankia sp. AgB32]